MLLKKEISDLVTLVAENEVFLNLIPMYGILPKYKKSAHATLNTMAIFNSSMLIDLLLMMVARMPFIIGKRMAFCFGKSFFLLLIMNAMHGISKAPKLR